MVTKRENYLLQFTENEMAHKLISKIDITKDKDSNLATLFSTHIKKKPLEAVFEYIKTLTQYPKALEKLVVKRYNVTKLDLFNVLIDFVKSTFPYPCLKCKEQYLPFEQEDSEGCDVKCLFCGVPAHKTCVKDTSINPDIGVVFLCDSCLNVKEKPTKTSIDLENGESHPDNKGSTQSTEESSSDEEDDEAWYVQKKKERKKKPSTDSSRKTDEICPLLMEGKCPHGLSGKECKYMHKRMCRKYCSFGDKEMHVAGCRFGDQCRFLHPKLCQNSVMTKSCYNKDCKLTHLKYTTRVQQTTGMQPIKPKRYAREDTNHHNVGNHRESNYHQYQRTADRQQADRQQVEERVRNSRGSYGNEDITLNQQTFLEKAIEKIQRELASRIEYQIKTQMQIHHNKIQEEKRCNQEHPNLVTPNNQSWTYREAANNQW